MRYAERSKCTCTMLHYIFSMVILFSGMNVQLTQAEEEFQVVTLIPAVAPVAGDIQLAVT